MKLRGYEIKESMNFWVRALLCSPVIAVFYMGYTRTAGTLNDLITGQGISGFGSIVLGLAVVAVFTFLSFRFTWLILYAGSLLVSNIMLLNNASVGTMTKGIMAAASIVSVVALVKHIQRPNKSQKATVKAAATKLSPESEAKYRATLAKLPSNPQLFQHYCSTKRDYELRRIATDLPTVFFRDAPCRESLEYIYRQDPRNAMLLVDIFIKFDEQGKLIKK